MFQTVGFIIRGFAACLMVLCKGCYRNLNKT